MATKSKSAAWFDENVSENQQDLINIGELANEKLHKIISLGLENPKTTIAMYAKIFECICDELVDKEEEWSDFRLNIANRLIMGYTTTKNEDDEKMGNFMVFIQHNDYTPSSEPGDDDETDTVVLSTEWNAANVKEQANIIKSIAIRGKKVLSDLINIKLDSEEFVIPMFCIIHEQIINYIRLKRVDTKASDFELNVAGLYTVGIQEITKDSDDEELTGGADDVEEDIYFIPSISLKLKFKSDKTASGKDE